MTKFNIFGYAKNIGITMFLGTSATGSPLVGTRKLVSARRRKEKCRVWRQVVHDEVEHVEARWAIHISSQLMSGTQDAPLPLIVFYKNRKEELVVAVNDNKSFLLLEEKPIGISGKTYDQPRLIQPPF